MRFPIELMDVVITPDAIERRIMCLDLSENNYFVGGMKDAVLRAEALGFALPPMDFEKYTRKPEPVVQVSNSLRAYHSMRS